MAPEKIKQAPRRRARNSLSRDLILDAAQSLARSGAEISLRSVASLLECSAMALYRHFPDKNDLLLGLLDRVIGSVDLAEETSAWDERLLKIAKGHLSTLQENPWAIPLLFEHPDPGAAVRKVGEAMLYALKQGGASDYEAVSTFSSILALNYGWAGFTAKISGTPGIDHLSGTLGAPPVPQDGLPETLALWKEFEHLGNNDHYNIAIRKLIS